MRGRSHGKPISARAIFIGGLVVVAFMLAFAAALAIGGQMAG